MMRFFINPGHDRKLDSGAVGFNLRECDVAYQIGVEVQRQLRLKGHSVNLLQIDDLFKICDSSNNFSADVFVSIHCNAFNGSARGTETYCLSERGRIIAANVQSSIVEKIGTVNRGVKYANFYVLRYTLAPAILIETAFIDNYADNLLLKTRGNDFATAIVNGLC